MCWTHRLFLYSELFSLVRSRCYGRDIIVCITVEYRYICVGRIGWAFSMGGRRCYWLCRIWFHILLTTGCKLCVEDAHNLLVVCNRCIRITGW